LAPVRRRGRSACLGRHPLTKAAASTGQAQPMTAQCQLEVNLQQARSTYPSTSRHFAHSRLLITVARRSLHSTASDAGATASRLPAACPAPPGFLRRATSRCLPGQLRQHGSNHAGLCAGSGRRLARSRVSLRHQLAQVLPPSRRRMRPASRAYVAGGRRREPHAAAFLTHAEPVLNRYLLHCRLRPSRIEYH
jgi:hypothetical protein